MLHIKDLEHVFQVRGKQWEQSQEDNGLFDVKIRENLEWEGDIRVEGDFVWVEGGSTHRVASSLARLADVMVTRNNVLRERNLCGVVAKGSKGGQVKWWSNSCRDCRGGGLGEG